MPTHRDIVDRQDVAVVVKDFYLRMLSDPILGFIFTDIAKIDLDSHLPVIVDFWCDILFREKNYHGNALQIHKTLHQKISLQAGHFTRWLYLFQRAVDDNFCGTNARLMKRRAVLIARTISATLHRRHKSSMHLTLHSGDE